MRFRRSPDPPEAGFDLTPMIDVVLLLIIFFTMTAHFARTAGTPLDLPRQRGEPAIRAPDHRIVIDLDKSGTLIILGRRMSVSDLARAVKTEVDRSSTPPDVLIRADRDCRSIHLNRLASALAAAGVRHWKLATEGHDEPAPKEGES